MRLGDNRYHLYGLATATVSRNGRVRESLEQRVVAFFASYLCVNIEQDCGCCLRDIHDGSI